MDVVAVGWSDVVRRRVAPALARVDGVDLVHVVTTGDACDLAPLGRKRGRVYTGPTGLQRALRELPDALVYVSGVNADHETRTTAALDTGHDVVVDKPAFLSSEIRDRCLASAERNGLLLAEATVWPAHAQVESLLRRIERSSLAMSHIDAVFTIPPLPSSNFRTDRARGGGVVADMGVYAMSPGRVFGAGAPALVTGEVVERSADGLDISMTVSMQYAKGVTVGGAFSLSHDYTNRLEVRGEGWSARLEPAFSSRPDVRLSVTLQVDGRDEGFTVEPSDPFERFLTDVVTRLDADERSTLTERTAESSADLLALAAAVGVDWNWARHDDDPKEQK